MYSGFRYTVFVSFVVCNALIVTSAIWNLSLVQNAGPFCRFQDLPVAVVSAAATSDKYSTFLGCAGLVFIFPVLFCEIANKDIFATKVWFELAWVALFCALGLVGAALSTVAGIDSLCQPPSFVRSPDRPLKQSILTSSTTVLCYLALLAVFSLLKNREDKTIWQCYARKFPWTFSQSQLPSTPLSPGHQRKTSKISLRRFITRSSKAPTIAAPRPRRAANDRAIQEGILSYRSGLSLEYEIEHFQPGVRPIVRPEAAFMIEEKYQPPQIMAVPATTPPSHSLYPEHMRAAIASVGTSPALVSSPPGPSPVGNWPQLNPPVRRLGHKSKGAITEVDGTTGYPPASPTTRTRPTGPRKPSISYASKSAQRTGYEEQPVGSVNVSTT
ncbi:hypothetical protein BKA70DRAFT_1457654 [Coprinopsis sp. MPI-PUGE-AT-0042]|nr:hypothetical protein BKA70DRAFT_1457654 [Coprinopsis sp. MPI-PUGE-AT-0042]